MRTFIILATKNVYGRIEYEMTARIEVQASSLRDAYHLIRTLPEFKKAYLQPE